MEGKMLAIWLALVLTYSDSWNPLTLHNGRARIEKCKQLLEYLNLLLLSDIW
jgi:hypothetical protein